MLGLDEEFPITVSWSVQRYKTYKNVLKFQIINIQFQKAAFFK